MYKIVLLLTIFLGGIFFSQSFDRIEFESFNAIVIGSQININLETLKNNKKGKVEVYFQSKESRFSKKISAKKYNEICNVLLKISDKDSIAQHTCIDGSSTYITIFKSNFKKKYFLDCISYKDQNDKEKKDFWYATKLILGVVGMRIEDLY